MNTNILQINVIWDSKEQVFSASSDDVPGLVAEAQDMNELVKVLSDLIPELLHENAAFIGEEDKSVRPAFSIIQRPFVVQPEYAVCG